MGTGTRGKEKLQSVSSVKSVAPAKHEAFAVAVTLRQIAEDPETTGGTRSECVRLAEELQMATSASAREELMGRALSFVARGG